MTGYPESVASSRGQHLMSRIVAVADAYDAMTSKRSYSAARQQDEALAVLSQNAGSAFDPVLVRLFVRMLGPWPPRSVVRLETGETAIVIKPGVVHPLKPLVRVIADSEGNILAPMDMDLLDEGAPRVLGAVSASTLGVDVDDFMQ